MEPDKIIAGKHIWHDVFNGGYGMYIEEKLLENRRNRKSNTYSEVLEFYYSKYIRICNSDSSEEDIKNWYIGAFDASPYN